MTKLKKPLFYILGGIVGLFIICIAFVFLMLDFNIDVLWYNALNYSAYFWTRLFYRYAVLLGVILVFFFLFYSNFWMSSKLFHHREHHLLSGNWLHLLRTGSKKISFIIALVLAVVIALPLFRAWEPFLLFLTGPLSGITDPIFQKDISFYLLNFPIYKLIQQELLIAFAILFAWVLSIYLMNMKEQKHDDSITISTAARVHLNLLLIVVIALAAWGMWLQRYALLFVDSHQPLFQGPGFLEMRVELPNIYLLVLSFVLLGSAAAVLIQIGKGTRATILLAIFIVIAFLARNTDTLKNVMDKYVVQPNELSKESPFIEDNIQTTLLAYNLADVQTIKHDYSGNNPLDLNDPKLLARLENTPVWDIELLDDVYQELQGIRTYYTFTSVDVNRYRINGRSRQVYSGVREIDISRLPDSAKSWVNRHLQYTHGQGIVMTPAAQPGDEPMTWMIKDIPPQSDYNINVKRPEIYFGLATNDFVIAPNITEEIGGATGDSQSKMVSYQGNGGVAMGSLFRKLMFSLYLDDRNIFFTNKTTDESRILFRRNIVDRIKLLAPFLTLDSDPYMVTTENGLFWIQDAYTTSSEFPCSPAYDGVNNYIRNSVKITVDAYNGNVSFYLVDPKDPIARAYQRIYPGLIKPIDDMPAEIKTHLNYPRDIFEIQMNIFAKYHQTDPVRFYRQEDLWEVAKMRRGQESVSMPSYYITIDLINSGSDEFVLLMPMTPFGRDNLRSIVLAGCDKDNYGKFFIYTFSREEQIYGPSQINALIHQDTDVSQAFTLWDQMASTLIRGKIIIEPVDGTILYIQPIYLQETQPEYMKKTRRMKIPQLKRLIVTQGDVVVMARSMKEAVAMLNTKLSELKDRKVKKELSPVPLPAPVETPANQDDQNDAVPGTKESDS